MELLKAAIKDRISRSLFLSRTFPLELVGYCWEPQNENSSRHIGLMFRVDIDNDHSAADLKKKEFRHGRGHALGGRFVSWEDLQVAGIRENLEAWSLAVVDGRAGIQGLNKK